MQKEQELEVKRQRALVSDILYPYLLKNTKSITEAKRLCYEVQSAMTQSFQTMIAQEQAKLSDSPTSGIVLIDITKKGAGFKVNQGLYSLLLKEKLSTTNALLGGMQQAIDSFLNEEMSKRDLSTLKADFL